MVFKNDKGEKTTREERTDVDSSGNIETNVKPIGKGNAEETAAAENVDFLNINDALQWNENNAAEYLVDSIHPNEEGRFLFGVEVTRAWR